MIDERKTLRAPDSRVGPVGEFIVAAVAAAVGVAIAWVDTRPTWDDAGMTAGALLLAAGLSAGVGLRWWGAAVVVATPILLAELPKAGWGVLAFPGITAAGSLLGAGLRRAGRSTGATRPP